MRVLLGVFTCFNLFIGANLKAELREYQSPNHVIEICLPLEKVPSISYFETDEKTEEKLCGIDFYSPFVALCGKEKSTSPGTYIYSLEDSNLTQAQAENQCRQIPSDVKRLGTYKQSMNHARTSATHSVAPLLYYHFSRYFEANTLVPVSVYRTMDVKTHYDRVTSKTKGAGDMNQAAWEIFKKAEQSPQKYNEADRLFTDNFKQIYGVLYKSLGERIGTYFYGTRESGWMNQYKDLMKAPPYLILSSTDNLNEAIIKAKKSLYSNSLMKSEIGFEPSTEQLYLWAHDMSEILILDYIFNQQDRVGNVDYIWAWVYSENGIIYSKNLPKEYKEISRNKMAKLKLEAPSELAEKNVYLIQKTILSDNDAGAMKSYLNFTKKFGLLNHIKHIHPKLYQKLQSLSADIKSNGPLKSYISKNFNLSIFDLQNIFSNIQEAAQILKDNCKNKNLKFDLMVNEYLESKTLSPSVSINCENS